MAEEYIFDGEQDFVAKIKELVDSGLSWKEITTFSPYPVHGLEDMLKHNPSPLKFFTLAGAITGGLFGLGMCIYAILVYPVNTGGKTMVSLPAYFIIGFELTILLGSLFSFLGLLILGRLPDVANLYPEKEYGNKFAIVVEK